MERIEETDEDVDFRPRKPALDRRYCERGVMGDGEMECRFEFGVTCMRWREG